jgi:hypothetical protein
MRRKRAQKSRLSENSETVLQEKDDSPSKENSRSSLTSPLKENSTNSNPDPNSPHKINPVESSQQKSSNNIETGEFPHHGNIDTDTASPVKNCDVIVNSKFNNSLETGAKQEDRKVNICDSEQTKSHDSGNQRRNSYETRSRQKNCSIEITLQPKKLTADSSKSQNNTPSGFSGSPLRNGSAGVSPTKSNSDIHSSPHKMSSSPQKADSDTKSSPVKSSGYVKEITFEHSLLDEYHSLSALRQKQRQCAVGRPGPAAPSPPSSPHLPATKQAAGPLESSDKESTLQEVLRRLGKVDFWLLPCL